MYKNLSVAVVVPAYNEERQIGRVIETIPQYVDHIVVVDDCSTDQTFEKAKQYASKDCRTVLLRHDVNQGVGGAIASGYKWCRDQDVDVAVVMAGDGQMDPEDMPLLLDPVADEGVDYTKANRLIYSQAYKTIPKVRFLGNSILSLLTKIASGYWHVADSQTGYTAIKKNALHIIDWDDMYKRYGQPNDLLVKLNVYNFRVRDVPMKPVYNIGERSGIRIRKVLFSISWLLIKGFFWRIREKYIIKDFHPLVFFYALGILMSVLFAGFFVRFVVLWNLEGSAPPMTAMAMLFCFGTALQSLFFAMMFDMEANRHLR